MFKLMVKKLFTNLCSKYFVYFELCKNTEILMFSPIYYSLCVYLPFLSKASALVCSKAKNLSLYRCLSSLSGSARGQYTLMIARSSILPFSVLKLEDIQLNPKCANRNKSQLLFSSAEMFKKPLWQTVWTQIRLLL